MKNHFELLHVGINNGSCEEAEKLAELLGMMFNLEPRKYGEKAFFVGDIVESLNKPGPGRNGHIAMGTEDLPAAMEELQQKGFSFDMSTAKYRDDGKIRNVYIEGEYGGFAIHVMQK